MTRSRTKETPYWERQVYDFLAARSRGSRRAEIVAGTHLGPTLVDAALSTLQRRARVTVGSGHWTARS